MKIHINTADQRWQTMCCIGIIRSLEIAGFQFAKVLFVDSQQ